MNLIDEKYLGQGILRIKSFFMAGNLSNTKII